MEEDRVFSNEQLKNVEARLLEQEHRPPHLLLNYLRRKRKWPDVEDPRRKAVQKAIIWRLFFSPAVVAVGASGLVGIITLFLLYSQNRKIDNQNDLINSQNELVSEQNRNIEIQANLEEAGRRNNLVFLMDNILNQVGDELAKTKEKDSSLSRPLLGRIVALSQGLLPYRFIDDKYTDSLVLTRRLSPERAQLLLALNQSGIGNKTMFYILSNTTFRRAYLRGATLIAEDISKVIEADFSGEDIPNPIYLNNITLSEADLSGAKIYIADMLGARLDNADLRNITLYLVELESADLSSADLTGANLAGVNFTDAGLLKVNFNNSKLTSIDFSGADLQEADLSKADLLGVNFKESDLRGVDLRWATLNEVKLEKLRYLDSCIVHREDWLVYIRDSLKLKGAKVLEQKYKTVLDTISDKAKISKEPIYRIVKK